MRHISLVVFPGNVSMIHDGRYTPNDDIVRHMVSLAARHPGLASLVTVGASSLGQNITGVRISRGLNSGPREILKPMVSGYTSL